LLLRGLLGANFYPYTLLLDRVLENVVFNYYFVMKSNPDSEEYQVDQEKWLIWYDHMLNDVTQLSVIEYE
jgi:hypothetical protein